MLLVLYTWYIVKISTALKHLFIPHEHNDYKPHFFRELSIGILVIVTIFLLGASFGSSFFLQRTVLGANVTADVLVDLTNESRLANNDAPLLRNPTLDRAATLKGDDMSANGYFSHNSPTGITPWHWFQQAGYDFLYAGENLAINFTDAKQVRDAWLASPTHRENLLDTRFKEIGMSTVSGIYKDSPTIYVVQLFGTPAAAKVVAPVAQVEATTTPQQPVVAEKPKEVRVSSSITENTTPNQPEIKGEATNTPETPVKTAVQAPLKSIIVTPTLAVVKNDDATAVEAVSHVDVSQVQPYAKWYERALFGGSYYADIFFKVLLGIVLIALIVMLTIEVRRQHWKHIAYGLALMLIITLSIIINQTFW